MSDSVIKIGLPPFNPANFSSGSLVGMSNLKHVNMKCNLTGLFIFQIVLRTDNHIFAINYLASPLSLNLLRNQLKVAKDNLAELKEVIGTLESEKSTPTSTTRILQQNDLKLSQEEVYNFTAVGTTTEAVTPSEAVTQTSISVVRPAKKTNHNGKKNQSQKNNQKGSGNRKDKKKEQEHGPQNILLESSNSRPGTSFNRQSEQQDSENRVVILGDSTVKGLQWWKMSQNHTKVQMRCFPGATVSNMKSYAIPTVRTDPSEIILHVGMNDLCHRSPREVAEDIISLCEDISQNTTAGVTISGLTHKTDEPRMGDKLTKTGLSSHL